MRLLDRRRLLAGLATVCAAPTHAAESPAGTLMVAGPTGGRLDRWAELLGPAIGRAMPARTPLSRLNVGGLDGVTGANQFEARGEPDGSLAMLVPGAAALSWIVGEQRAKFDPARWVPLWAGATPAVLVSRVALTPGRTLLVTAPSPVGPELPALLALDLFGIQASPTPAPADAMLVTGPGTATALATARAAGYEPVMTLGALGSEARDPLLPTVPTALELVRGRASDELLGALRAASLAVQLEAGLVLPQLTPAGSVALWRRACTTLAQDSDVTEAATRRGVRLLPADLTANCTSGMANSPESLLSLRQWLVTRYDWRPTQH